MLNLSALVGLLMSACVLTSALADEAFPKRSVTIVVPYAAGGVTDLFARTLGNRLAKIWGQPVVVDNRSGGGTIIGTQAVARAAADGHTLLFTSYAFTSNLVLRPNWREPAQLVHTLSTRSGSPYLTAPEHRELISAFIETAGFGQDRAIDDSAEV